MELATTDEEIGRCFPAMHALRPHLTPDRFLAAVRRQQGQGYRLAYLQADGRVQSVAGFRVLEFLAWGKVLYIDDLVTLPETRGRGIGGALLDQVVAHAREQGCDAVHLDSGHARYDAHRFYLNRRFRIEHHHFVLRLSEPPAGGPR